MQTANGWGRTARGSEALRCGGKKENETIVIQKDIKMRKCTKRKHRWGRRWSVWQPRPGGMRQRNNKGKK